MEEEETPTVQPTLDVTPASEQPPAGPAPPSFVYALGRVEPRFPSLAVEKEFAQASGRGEGKGLTDDQALQG